ncbi:amino acid adenylation domain-containing protein [Actinomycetes bacterium KLBMP 9797]
MDVTGRPLTAAQLGIWSGQHLDPTSPAYNAAQYVEVRGPLRMVEFETALRDVLAAADTLHLRFPQDDGLPRLAVARHRWPLTVLDLRGEADPWAAAHAWMRTDLATPVELARGPLFAQAVFVVADDRHLWYQRAHHIALDGYAFALVARRVAERYTALVTGRPDHGRLDPLAPVLAEDERYRASNRYAEDGRFWAEALAGMPPPVTLGAGGGAARDVRRRATDLPPSSVDAWRALAGRAGGGWPDVVAAVVAGYAHRVTGAPEIVLGLPVMGRLGSAALRTPCMAMNILPLRVPVPAGATWTDVVRQVSGAVRATRPHQRYRYEQMRRDLRLVAGQRRLFGPVVNVMPFDHELSFAGHRGVVHPVSAGPVEDLSVSVVPSEHLRLVVDANPRAYDEEALAGHHAALLELLATVPADPDRPVAPPAARRADVTARSVTELILDRARERGDAPAVRHGDRRLTYAELVAGARGVAAELVARGAGPGTTVALHLPRDATTIVAILGVLFSGAAYLPLDRRAPAARTGAILRDAEPALVVGTARTAAELGLPSDRVLCISDVDGAGVDPAPADGAAYVIYTSGSTGVPKGVVVGHPALAAFVAAAGQRYGIHAGDRVLQFAAPHFDASVEEIFLTLCAGATLVLRDEDTSIATLLDTCVAAGVTVLDLPTAFWHELTDALAERTAVLPPSVRTVIIGGEAALPARVARWRRTVGDRVTLLNTYGPTEATVVATVATLAGPGAAADPEAPIGWPLPGVRAEVRDATGAPADHGELYLAGAQLADGYLNRPELTAERFPRGPTGERWYRTGDLVRRRADGALVYAGRADHQVKIRGFRVELGEVEAVLATHPAVGAVAAAAHRTGTDVRLVGYVTPAPGAAAGPDPAEVRRHLAGQLPDYLVPAAVLVLPRLPLTSTGKVDRAALPAPAAAGPPAGGVRAGGTPGEELLRRLFASVLGVPDVGLGDDFFELGGHSLLAVRLAGRVQAAFGRPIGMADLFAAPTVAALAARLDASGDPCTSAGGGPCACAGGGPCACAGGGPCGGAGGGPCGGARGGLCCGLGGGPCACAGGGDPLAPLLPLRAGGDRPPLFCVPPVTGLAWCYAPLGSHLKPGRPIYGLQAVRPPEPDPGAGPLDGFLARIRAVQPDGPYHLLGWSAGGVLAHALASRLQADGGRVELLALLDSYPGPPPPGSARAVRPPAGLDAATTAAVARASRRTVALLRRLRHPLFDGDVRHFRASVGTPAGYHPHLWRPYVTGAIQVHEVTCTHRALISPNHLAEVARVLDTPVRGGHGPPCRSRKTPPIKGSGTRFDLRSGFPGP